MILQGTFKTRFFFPAGKRTVFGIQRKRGSQRGQVVPNRDPAARLYAPVEVRPRPQWTTSVEQGKPVVLFPLFSPPAWVGVETWWRCLIFPLSRGATSSGQSPFHSEHPCGHSTFHSLAPPLPRKALRAFPGPPDRAHGTAPQVGVGADIIRPQNLPPTGGKVARRAG